MSYGINIKGTHSDTFGICIKTRSIGAPAKRMVTATVPYMSGYYDFSGIYNDEPAYDGRELVYTFDILEDTPEEVEKKKNAIISWAMLADNSELWDDYDPEYFFTASYESAEFTEDEELPELGGELALTFMAQPYRTNRSTGARVIP